MVKYLVAFAAAAALVLAASPTTSARPHSSPTPSPTPPPADPAITALARQQFVQWQAGVVNRKLYDAEVLPQLTDTKIAQTSQLLGQLGALDGTVYVGPWFNPDHPQLHGYIYQMRCTQGNVYLWLALDPAGKIANIFFKNRLDVETVTPTPSETPPDQL